MRVQLPLYTINEKQGEKISKTPSRKQHNTNTIITHMPRSLFHCKTLLVTFLGSKLINGPNLNSSSESLTLMVYPFCFKILISEDASLGLA